MKKKLVTGLLVLCLVLSFPLGALAAPEQTANGDESCGYVEFTIDDAGNITVIDQANGTSQVYGSDYSGDITLRVAGGVCSLSKNGSTLTAWGKTTNYTSTKLYVKVNIQKKSGSSWSNISGGSDSNSTTGTSVTASVSKSVSSGTYRCKGTHTVNGSTVYSESGTKIV